MASVFVKPRSRILHGHDWIYSGEILKTLGNPEDGGIVTIKDNRARPLGSAIFNSKSQIVARRFSRQHQDLDADFFKRRIEQAVAYRARRNVDPLLQRVVWSESDGLPGVVLDRYGSCLVLQTLTLAMDLRRNVIADIALATLGADSVIERNDSPSRKAEGIEPRCGPLAGAPPQTIDVAYDGIIFRIDPLSGQKTGLYLDQRENYRAVAEFASGRRVLDCFSNQGGFALFCARAGATSVRAVEISADCCAAIGANAARNNLLVEPIEANAFDVLKAEEQSGAQYDLIILDPPSFTRTKQSVHDAFRGYKEIHLRALKMLSPDGIIATFSCSHHIGERDFLDMIAEASFDAKRHVRLIRRFGQAADHPVLPHLPETEYLRGFLLESMPGR